MIDLKAIYEGQKNGSNKFTRRMAINMADMLDMDVKSLVIELERQGLLKSGSWDWFRANGGFTREHFEEARAQSTQPKETGQ